ncbi:hypothetical protein RB594_000988 [Gaeumannomyces avenae]
MDTRSKRKAAQQLTPPSSFLTTRPTTRHNRNIPFAAAIDDGTNGRPPAGPLASRSRSEPGATKASDIHSYGTRSRRRAIVLTGADTVASQELADGGRRDGQHGPAADSDSDDDDDYDTIPTAFAPAPAAPGPRKRKAPVTGILDAQPSPRKAKRTKRGGPALAASDAIRSMPDGAYASSDGGGRLATRLRSKGQNRAAQPPVDLPRPPAARGGRSGRRGSGKAFVEDVEDRVRGDETNDQAEVSIEVQSDQQGDAIEGGGDQRGDTTEVEDDQEESIFVAQDYREDNHASQEEEHQDGMSKLLDEENSQFDDQETEEEARPEYEDANGPDPEAREAEYVYELSREVEEDDYVAEEDTVDDDAGDDDGDAEEHSHAETPDDDNHQAPQPRPASSLFRPASFLPRPAPRPERGIAVRRSDAPYEVPLDNDEEAAVSSVGGDERAAGSVDGDARPDVRHNELPLGSANQAALELELATVSQGCIAKLTRLMGKEAWAGSGDSWPQRLPRAPDSNIGPVRDLKDSFEDLKNNLAHAPRNTDLVQQARFFRHHAPLFEDTMNSMRTLVERIARYLRHGRRPATLARDLMKTALPMGVLALGEAFDVAGTRPPEPGRRYADFSVPMAAIVQCLARCMGDLLVAMQGVPTGGSEHESRLHQKQRDTFLVVLTELREGLARAEDQAAANAAEVARREELDRERELIQHQDRLRAMERDERLRRIRQRDKAEAEADRHRRYEAFVRSCQRPRPAGRRQRAPNAAEVAPRRPEPATAAPAAAAVSSSSSAAAEENTVAPWEREPEEQEDWRPTRAQIEYVVEVLGALGPDERFPLSAVAARLERTAPEVAELKRNVTDMAKRRYAEQGVPAEEQPDWVFK